MNMLDIIRVSFNPHPILHQQRVEENIGRSRRDFIVVDVRESTIGFLL